MIQNIGKTLILWLGIILAVTIGAIIWVQNSLLFYPNTSIFNWSPEDKSISQPNIVRDIENQQNIENNQIIENGQNSGENIENGQNGGENQSLEEIANIMIPDHKGGLSAYYIANFPNKDFLIYCHGTSGNIADRKYVFDMVQEHQLNLLLFDYHGYGKSPSYPTVESILRDGLTVIDFLHKTKYIDMKRMIVWGESLGGAVAAYISKLRPIKGVVLMATFSSMPMLVSEMESLGWVRFPLAMISRITLHSLETARWISQTKIPVVVMHSKEDDYISYNCGYRNFEVAKEPKMFIEIGGKHISPKVSFENIQQALQFINANQ